MPYIKISCGGGPEIKTAPEGADLLELMQGEVGGYIETISARGLIPELGDAEPTLLMIINEEGKLHELAFNELATCLLATGEDYIVGDALLLKIGLDECEETNIVELSDSEARRIYEIVGG